MATPGIVNQRLHNQRLAGEKFEKPADVVKWLGAVQSQDYAGAKWAVAQRTNGLTDADIEKACSDGDILRTHILRPTWHFITPTDIRWMLELTAPRVKLRMIPANRQTNLDDTILAKSNDALIKGLRGGKQFNRAELGKLLGEAGIDVQQPLRLGFILINAELDGIICSGTWRGKQPAWALIDERAPQAKTLSRDQALAELAIRYFTSHGPATLKDYVWWSGLTTTDARSGLEQVKSQLNHAEIEGQTYWFAGSITENIDSALSLYLLPNYDEYIVAYVDRTGLYNPQHDIKLDARGNFLFNHTIVLNSQVVGTWKRTLKKGVVIIESTYFTPLNAAQIEAFKSAARRYAEFLSLSVVFAEE